MSSLRFWAVVTALVVFTSGSWAQIVPGAFGPSVLYQNFYGASGVHIDLDADGDEDLVFPTNFNALGTTINSLPTSLFNGPFLPLTFNAVAVRVGDVDGDGVREIVAVGTQKIAVVRIVTSTIVTSEYSISTGATSTGTVKLIDVDRDGDKDLLIHGPTNSGQVNQIINDGNGQFTSNSPIFLSDGLGEGMTAGDLDADGDIDVATFGSVPPLLGQFAYATTMKVMMQTEPGTTTLVQEFPVGSLATTEEFRRAVVLDFDGDGNLDIAFSSCYVNLHVTYMRNIGSGIFRQQLLLAPINNGTASNAGNAGRLDVTDLDANGSDDIAVIARFPLGSSNLVVYRWNPSGGAPLANSVSLGTFTFDVAFAPLDATSGVDLLTTAATQSNPSGTFLGYDLRVHPGNFVQSTPPAEIISVVRGTLAEAQFGRPFDAETIVSVRDRDGLPLVGRSVSINYPTTTPNPSTVMTDASGFASIALFAGASGGEVTAQFATANSNTTSTKLFEVGLVLSQSISGSNTILDFTYHYPRSGTALLFAVDFPLAAPGFVATPYGDVFTSILSPSPTAAVLDGLGIFLPADPTMVTSPNWFRSATVPNAWLQANTFIVQMYGYDYTKPFPEGLLISNPISL